MAKIKQSPKLPAEQRREQLLESARKLFSEKGYRGTSTEEIAANAGLTKGALYFHFKSKEEILVALVKAMSGRFKLALESLPKPITPWELIEIVVCHTEATTPKEFRSILDIWVQAIRLPKVRKFLKQEHHDRIAYVTAHFDPGIRLSKEEARQLATLTFCLCDGVAGRRIFNKESMDMPMQMKLVRTMMESFYRKEL